MAKEARSPLGGRQESTATKREVVVRGQEPLVASATNPGPVNKKRPVRSLPPSKPLTGPAPPRRSACAPADGRPVLPQTGREKECTIMTLLRRQGLSRWPRRGGFLSQKCCVGLWCSVAALILLAQLLPSLRSEKVL